ncbi:MAG: signal peptidase II [Fuerstiella sp.]|nr:signal peptidase II [Fuerstiella sp.]
MNHVPVSRVILYGLLSSFAVSLDLVSKSIAFRQLRVHTGTDWLMDGWLKFRLFTSINQGALWGVGQGLSLWFAALSVAAVAGILYWLFWRQGCQSIWLTTALAVVSGGTLGNLYDRLGMHGLQDSDGNTVFGVRDFLDFRLGSFDWAIFNVADVCLVTGAVMLMLQSIMTPPPSIAAEVDQDPFSMSGDGDPKVPTPG